jgi:hypothetical protein
MSNTWINPTVVAKEALRQLKNNTVMGELVYRGYEQEWAKNHNGYKPGSSITIKAPVYARVKTSATLDTVEANERSMTITLDQRLQVSYAVTSAEMTYNSEKNVPRLAEAAAQAIGEYVDRTLLGLYKGVPNQVGIPGQTPKDFLTLALANAKLSQHAVPTTDRRCVVDPMAQAYIADALKNLYNPPMVGPAVERAKFSSLAGMDTFVSQNVNMHTCGTSAGVAALAVDATAPAEGATGITIDNGSGDWTTTLKQGDIFTVATVHGVNPVSGVSTGALRQFVVEADADDSGTECLVSCTPGVAPYNIYSSAANEKYLPYQTVDDLPAENDVVTVAGSTGLVHPVNLAFHRDAFALCMVPIAVPMSVSWSATASYEGYSMRVLRDYDVTNDQEYLRFDCLFGIKVINPFMSCRIAG